MTKFFSVFGLVIPLFISFTSSADNIAYIPDHVGEQGQNGRLHIVNTTFNIIVESVILFGNPRDVLINSKGDTVFISTEVEEQGEEKSFINVLDTSNNQLVAPIEIPDAAFVTNMVMDSTESRLFVTHDRGVTVVNNPYSLAYDTDEILTTYRGNSLVITEDDNYLFVLGEDRNGVDGVSLVSLKDTINDEVFNVRLGVGKLATSMLYLKKKNKLYVVNRGSDELRIFAVDNYNEPEIAELTEIDTHIFPEDSAPSKIVYDADRNELLVTLSYFIGNESFGNGYITVLNADDTRAETSSGLNNFFLSDEEGEESLFDPIHPSSIAVDEFGGIHVIKHIWNENSGLYLVGFKDSTKNEVRTVTENSSIRLGDRSSTLSTGNFVGPDCEACPDGLDDSVGDVSRPSSLSTELLLLLLMLLVIRLGIKWKWKI